MVSVGVRVEHTNKYGIVVIENRLVFFEIVRRIEDHSVSVRDEDVREAAFPWSSHLHQRAIEVSWDRRVSVDTTPAVHTVRERLGTVTHLL
jgi:acyl-CoA thioesterase FadM